MSDLGPLPEPVKLPMHPEHGWTWTRLERECLERWAAALVAAERERMSEEIGRLRAVLELIAAPKRPDGTWNRDREACRLLSERALRGEL